MKSQSRHIKQRLLASVFVLIGVTILVFALIRIGNGDPAAMMAGDLATPEEIEEYRVRMGLDKPLIVQYFTYMSGLFKGDLGYSYVYSMPVGMCWQRGCPRP